MIFLRCFYEKMGWNINMQSQNILKMISKSQGKIKYVFFDFFDTIIHRKCSPDTIKQLWALEIEKKLEYIITAKELYQLRIESERFLHNKRIEENYQILSLEICKRLLNSGYISKHYNIEKCAQFMKQVEIKIEKTMQYRDDSINHLLAELKKRNLHIVIISDFYLEGQYLKEFCENCGVEDCFDEIFVSCECGKSKSSGTLYTYILEKLNIKVESCLMIGDNFKSDIKNAKRVGLNTYYQKYQGSDNLISEHTIKIKLNDIFKKSVHSLYDGYAFPLYYFTETLYYNLKKDKIKNIIFFSREGEFLKKLFDFYLKKKSDATIHTHYCYISRKSSFLASLHKIEDETFDTYFRQFNTSNITQFLSNLDFDKNEQDKVKSALSIKSNEFEIVHSSLQTSEIFYCLLNNKTFCQIYKNKTEHAKHNFTTYLNTFGINWENEGMFIVDVGWKGTIQDNIYHYFDGKICIHGYYLGLCELTNVSKNNIKTGVLFSKVPYLSKYYEELSGGYLLYEKILRASHPSTMGYESIDNEIRPIFDFKEYENNSYLQVKVFQDRIYNLYIKIVNIFLNSCIKAFDLTDFFALIQIKTFMKTSKEDIKLWNYLEDCHYENFGVLLNQKELRKLRGKKYYLQKYKKYLKENIHLFSSEHFLRTVLRLEHLHLGILIYIYKVIVYIIEKNKIERERN